MSKNHNLLNVFLLNLFANLNSQKENIQKQKSFQRKNNEKWLKLTAFEVGAKFWLSKWVTLYHVVESILRQAQKLRSKKEWFVAIRMNLFLFGDRGVDPVTA